VYQSRCVVCCNFAAFQHVKTESESVKESLCKGQVGTSGISGINSFDLEILS